MNEREPFRLHAPRIEAYLAGAIPPRDEILAEMERYAAERDFPIVGPQVGRLLALLAGLIRAERVFELGSGFGYSAYWLCRALGPGGRVIATDGREENAARAREFFGRAGLADRLEFRVGEARDVLRRTPGPFDLILVDIDKAQYPEAFDLAVPRLRPGGLLIADNMLRDGRVLETPPDEGTAGVLAYTRKAMEHPDLWTVILPVRDGVGVSWRRA